MHRALSQAALAPQSPLTPWPFPCAPADWEQTPPTVQAHLTALHQEVAQLKARVDTLEARTQATSQTSSRPPSSDSPSRKPRPNQEGKPSGRPGAKPGPPGVRQTLLSPTATEHLVPTAWRCGSTALAPATPYSTHQVIARPPIAMDIPHWVLHHAACLQCGRRVNAELPPEHRTGYGPRLSALLGEMAGVQGTSRSLIHTVCASVLGCPMGLGAIPNVLDRVTLAIQPHYATIAQIARHAPVNSIDETALSQFPFEPFWGMIVCSPATVM